MVTTTTRPVRLKLKRSPKTSGMVINPTASAIAARLTRMTAETVGEIARPKDEYKISDYFGLLKNDPVIRASYELKALRAAIAVGDVTHKIDAVQSWMRSNVEGMEDRLENFFAQGSSAAFFGSFVAEIVFTAKAPGFRNQWRLKALRPLDPRKVTFKGNKYGITDVIWRGDGKPKVIPYKNIIHVVGDHAAFGDPYGVGLARLAMPFYKAKQVLTSEWVVAGLNQARGMLIGFADSNESVQILGPNGQVLTNSDGSAITRSAVENLLLQLQNLENSSIVATDLRNRVEWRQMPVDANFFQLALQYLDRKSLLTQLLPSLTFEEGIGGLGNSGVANVQKGLVDSQIEGIVTSIKDQIIEKVWRPLLTWNFGFTGREGWGEFVIKPDRDPNVGLQRANIIMSALMSQLLPSSDPVVMNSFRELIGLPETNEQQMMEQLRKQMAIQAMQQGNANPEPEPVNAGGQDAQMSRYGFYPF